MKTKGVISIEELSDEHDCDTCGPSWATGYRVTLDGNEILNLEPHAYCYGGVTYYPEEMYKMVLEELGYKVLPDDNV